MSFWDGFEKQATKKEDTHKMQRFLLGNPLSAAIEAKSGKRGQAFKESYKHSLKETGKGLGVGAGGGAILAALFHPLARTGVLGQKMKHIADHIHAGQAAGAGAMAGGLVGSTVGGVRGQFGEEATKIHQKYIK